MSSCILLTCDLTLSLKIDIDDVTTHSCILIWTPPSDDGGTAILRYVIKQRETSRHLWAKLDSVKAELNKYEVAKLNDGREYEFQVRKQYLRSMFLQDVIL